MCRYRPKARIDRCSLSRCPWLSPDIVESLVGLNEQILDLLARQADAPSSQSNTMLRQFRELWRQMDWEGRELLATTHYLLADMGFMEAERWGGPVPGVHDAEIATDVPFFTVPGAALVARRILYCAWDLARTNPSAACLFLCIPPHCCRLIGVLSVHQVEWLAEQHQGSLMPRLFRSARFWRSLMLAANAGEGPALTRARNHGLDLIEADTRIATLAALRGMQRVA